ncbi:MAG: excinuclease ABC subunit UvrA [Bacteroidia bacterium]|jgi:excinuclease ABC subunit A
MNKVKPSLRVEGAREHNLKNIDVEFPRNSLVVITGLSGSGKSSLAFDTIYAEGQRRYLESFSSYVRQFLGNLERPDVDRITGLSPVVAIEQKTTNKNPRSTVGTITEIYDFLRVLYARAATALSPVTGEPMVRYSQKQMQEAILDRFQGSTIQLLAPLVKGRKGHYRELFERCAKLGFLKVRIDGQFREITLGLKLDRYKVHDIEISVDTLEVDPLKQKRLERSLETALKLGKGSVLVLEKNQETPIFLSKNLMCPTSGISFDEPAPNLFSFNSPYGACPKCNGIGQVNVVAEDKIFPNPLLSIKKGGIAPLGTQKNGWMFKQLEQAGWALGFTMDTPIQELAPEIISTLLNGHPELLKFKSPISGISGSFRFDGIAPFIVEQADNEHSSRLNRWAKGFMEYQNCPTCLGSRLKPEVHHFILNKASIVDLGQKSILELQSFMEELPATLNPKQTAVASEVLKELKHRISFLLEVGLGYLTLNRSAKSLSGGEAQRIRLATQIGSKLVGVLYILDEPSIGLHQRDNHRLIQALKILRDAGNSILVVEHDKDIMLESDFILDMGPGAGIHGGTVVASGSPDELIALNSITAQYLSGKLSLQVPSVRRPGNGKEIEIKGASGHNLKSVNTHIPLGCFVCVTGVSGSGKSSLINETLYPVLANALNRAELTHLPFLSIKGISNLDKVIRVDQSPIGRTPRSNPATYTGVFNDIRQLFTLLPESKIRGYAPGRFSFNVKGGRCETCRGGGVEVIEMNFLPDVEVMCPTCHGKRYNSETLEVRYKGASISDVLDMTLEKAVVFFEHIPAIFKKISVLNEIGLGYLTLGQRSTTLSGGEAQRVKLATELQRPGTGNTLYILDEPTTGLHFEDVRLLLNVLDKLVEKGNSVLVIEHNMDVIKSADYLIDLGPEGGNQGGQVLFQGLPEEMLSLHENHTARFLAKEL